MRAESSKRACFASDHKNWFTGERDRGIKPRWQIKFRANRLPDDRSSCRKNHKPQAWTNFIEYRDLKAVSQVEILASAFIGLLDSPPKAISRSPANVDSTCWFETNFQRLHGCHWGHLYSKNYQASFSSEFNLHTSDIRKDHSNGKFHWGRDCSVAEIHKSGLRWWWHIDFITN